LIYSHTAAPDADGDGIPDYWETQHGFNPNDPSDASLDSDGDGYSTLQEYVNYGDPHLNLAQSLNLSANVPITNGGDASWFDQTLITHDGTSAAQCGIVGNNQSSYFEIPVTGPGVSFWWKVSSEATWDFLKVYVDGVQTDEISGDVDWTQVFLRIPSGSHLLRFSYENDLYDSNGNNAGWVDLVTTLPDSDGDGMPDYWEIQNGLNPNDPSDASLDPDGDGVSNLQEYIDPRLKLPQSLNLPAARVTSGGNASWFYQRTVTHDGVDAAQSGSTLDNHTSFFELPVAGPDTISFWWKVSSEQNYDFLKVYLDGSRISGISGEVDWTQMTLPVPNGLHTLRFAYEKDYIVSRGSDAGWVDQIVTHPPQISQVACNSEGSVSINWKAHAGTKYRIEFSSDLVSWQNLNSNLYTSATDTIFTVTDPTSPRPVRRFYRVVMAY
jgi:hypothetical protein